MSYRSEQIARIPSTDGVTLEARIGTPVVSPTTRKDVCVIVTHPYGSLGGNLQNNVVEAVVKALGKDYMTVRFNFRGVGGSTSRGTFNGQGETEDLLSVWRYVRDRVDLQPRFFLLVGYSYGCIPCAGACMEIEGCIGVATISFPASVMWFLTFGNSAKYTGTLRAFSLPKLFIMGTRDNFTSIKAFEQMTSTMSELKHVDIIDNMDHFWFDREDVVVECIRKWIRTEKLVPQRARGVPLAPLDSIRDVRKADQQHTRPQTPTLSLDGNYRIKSVPSAESLNVIKRSPSPRRSPLGGSLDLLSLDRDDTGLTKLGTEKLIPDSNATLGDSSDLKKKKVVVGLVSAGDDLSKLHEKEVDTSNATLGGSTSYLS
ncbi:hypothetical protein HDU99_003059 [Rhizoclosmatium hyalinum]|nr:hypothetical protein HDU99_003059 [Rhizoclosmatium hyalinum]